MTNSATAAGRSKVRYEVDVRLYLALITASMALAFGIGVAFGPTYQHTYEIPQDVPEIAEVEGTAVKQNPRLPTDHIASLGPKAEHVHFVTPTYEDLGDGVVRTSSSDSANASTSSREYIEHIPAGQHLLMDMKNVDEEFLNSESRLAQAILDVVKAGGFTLLSYHCHSLEPSGVSCVGVLLESHISFHTWPVEGVITLDLFTCGSNPLLPLVDEVERLFGVPRAGEEVLTMWGHELRGFRPDSYRESDFLDEQSDLHGWLLSSMDMIKQKIVSKRTKFQQVDIWDAKKIGETPSHEDGLRAGLKPGDPRWFTDEFTGFQRYLFLDGTAQSISRFEREYHESLVHPAMFAHPNPRNVAIVGGGEGATLREVLKHKTLESALMIELDSELVEICREHLPQWSNCTDLVGRADSCFDDERSEILYEDGQQYFMDRFGDDASVTPDKHFDVIIMDALDPEDCKEISKALFTNEKFLSSLIAGLTDDGVLVIQVGTGPRVLDPKAEMGIYSNREMMFNTLEKHPSVATMLVYEEDHCGFNEPHAFLVVCKSADCRQRWYSEADAVDFQIYERIVQTHSKDLALVHYDGTTQGTYQVPPITWEHVYCRREPMPAECNYRGLDLSKKLFDMDLSNLDKSNFEVKGEKNSNGDMETSVFTRVDIPKGSYVFPEHLASSFMISDASIANLQHNTEVAGKHRAVVIEDFLEFVEDHGHASLAEGSARNFVEVGVTYMIREVEEGANIGRWKPDMKWPAYSPVYDRHHESFDVYLIATREIKAGEEILKPVGLWD